MSLKQPAAPQVNSNGTSQPQLFTQYVDALTAMQFAITAVTATTPVPCDYEPQGEDAFKTATDEHITRLRHLEAIYNELLQIAQKVAET